MIMDKISILDTVKPSLEKLKRIQTEETKPLVKELEDKLEIVKDFKNNKKK